MPKLTKKIAPKPVHPVETMIPRVRPGEPPQIIDGTDVSSLAWARSLFVLFGKEKLIDGSEGQDALYVAVKMSPSDRALLLRLLKRLAGK